MKVYGRMAGTLALFVILVTSCIRMGGSGAQIKTFADGAAMARAPKGAFIMGSSTGNADQRPEHNVVLTTFWIDQYEVTNERYVACVSAGKCRENEKYEGLTDSDQPVVGVSWFDAADYCAFVGKRLPTEAEWEKAARGQDGREYPWGNSLDCRLANYRECRVGKTTPVGAYPAGASPYRLLDMAGNAAEWVNDWYDPNYYQRSPKDGPKGPETGKYRVIRGGMWLRYAYQMRSADRAAQSPDTRNNTTGFRCAKDG